MRVGLLWYDDDPRRSLAEKIGRAARRYKQKHGVRPDVCYVHPSSFEEEKLEPNSKYKVGGIRVVAGRSVLRHHFWIGRESPGSSKEIR